MIVPLSAYRNVRALVLGASGFIGRWVVRRLAEESAEVYALVRDQNGAARLASVVRADHIRYCDVADFDALADEIGDISPDIAFNLAGYGVNRAEREESVANRINQDVPRVLCQAMGRLERRSWRGQAVVHAGTALEYGLISGDLRESSRPAPTTMYGRTKLAGTIAVSEECERLGLRGLTARLFTVYGPGERSGRLLPMLIDTAATRQPLRLTSGVQRRDFTYVEEVAEGLLRLGISEANPGAIVNLATGKLHSVRQFTETAARILGLDTELLRFDELPMLEGEMDHDPVAIDLLRSLTSWCPTTDITAGIERTACFGVQTP